MAEEQGEMPLGDEGGRYDGVPDHKWPRRLVERIEVIEARFLRMGYADGEAFKLAAEAVMELAKFQGGRMDYLPTGEALETALKHAEIYRRANRDNIDALAVEYGMTPRHVYRIISEQRKLHIKRTQRELHFEGGEGC